MVKEPWNYHELIKEIFAVVHVTEKSMFALKYSSLYNFINMMLLIKKDV